MYRFGSRHVHHTLRFLLHRTALQWCNLITLTVYFSPSLCLGPRALFHQAVWSLLKSRFAKARTRFSSVRLYNRVSLVNVSVLLLLYVNILCMIFILEVDQLVPWFYQFIRAIARFLSKIHTESFSKFFNFLIFF